MNPEFDTVIVGAGLAGAAAALFLSEAGRVLVLDAGAPAAGASGAAAGLVNPLMGRKARSVWQADAALDALTETLARAGAVDLFARTGLLRPAADAAQAATFRAAAEARPEAAAWLTADAARERVPGLAAPEGALWVRHGGALNVADFVRAMLAAAQRHGAGVRTPARVVEWGEEAGAAFVEVDGGERIMARRVLLTMGYGYRAFAETAALNLHAVKGQTARVAWPEGLDLAMPLSGRGYVVPDGGALVVGSSYERGFADLEPSEAVTRQLLTKAARMLPALSGAPVLGATAGARVTVPGTRLPMLGPLPGRQRIWIFTGLGSKGLLMAPLLARRLAEFFEAPGAIPEEIAVQLKR